MAATYDPLTPTGKDFVRLWSGDRDTLRAKLDDDEIESLLREQPNKWLAAADACDLIKMRNDGIVSKQVEDLKLQYGGVSINENDAYNIHIKYLRERGAKETMKSPTMFRVLGINRNCRYR